MSKVSNKVIYKKDVDILYNQINTLADRYDTYFEYILQDLYDYHLRGSY